MSRLGQIFLRDRRILNFIAEQVHGKILEIGAGDGRLTKLLVQRGEVWAIEIDSRFESKLREITSNVIIGDFLELEPFDVDFIVGNVPYYISSPILFRLLDWKFKLAILMFQKEFVDKMLMTPDHPKYGRLSVSSKYYYKTKPLKIVSRYSFSPVPKVDSTIVQLEKLRDKDEIFDRWVSILFTHKNKKIKNIIQDAPSKYANLRPDRLNIEELLELIKKLEK